MAGHVTTTELWEQSKKLGLFEKRFCKELMSFQELNYDFKYNASACKALCPERDRATFAVAQMKGIHKVWSCMGTTEV